MDNEKIVLTPQPIQQSRKLLKGEINIKQCDINGYLSLDENIELNKNIINKFATNSEGYIIQKQLKIFRKIEILQTVSSVYFLLQDTEIVYIGKSNRSLPSRIEQHKRDKKKIFNKIAFILTPEHRDLEGIFIKMFLPKYNITMPSISGYRGVTLNTNHFELSDIPNQKLSVIINNIDYRNEVFILNNRIYLNVDFLCYILGGRNG